MRRRIHLLGAGLFLCLGFFSGISLAQEELSHNEIVARANDILIRVVAGEIDDSSARMAVEMSLVLDVPEKLRILPMMSRGGAQNLADLLYLKGVDVSIVRSDVLNHLSTNGMYPDATSRLRYVSKLHNEVVYVVAGSAYQKLSDLAGKPVNFGRAAKANESTSELVFNAVGIEVRPSYIDHVEAIAKIKTGELAATVVVNAVPSDFITGLKAQDGLKLLPIEYTEGLDDSYLPSSLTHKDFPNLIPPNQSVDTLATGVVMIVFNWPNGHARYERVNRFVTALFTKFGEFRQPPRHPMWMEVSLGAALPGWTRFQAAQDWLERYGSAIPGTPALIRARAAFQRVLEQEQNGSDETLDEARRVELFRNFLATAGNQAEATIQVHMTSESGVGTFVGTISAKNIEISIASTTERALLLTPSLVDLPPGPHALHIHENPNCGPAVKDGTMVAGLGAGGHLFAEQNGKTYGSHLGDLPDLLVAEDGSASEGVIAPRLTLADLLNRSVVVHASDDDASPRQACGVID